MNVSFFSNAKNGNPIREKIAIEKFLKLSKTGIGGI